jgi:hypothetical protein
MVGPGGVTRFSNFNGLKLQTCVSVRIECKSIFGAVTNWKIEIPLPRISSVKHIAGSHALFAARGHAAIAAGEERKQAFVISLEGLRGFRGFSAFSDKPGSFRVFDGKQLIGAVRITRSHSTLSDTPETYAPLGAG